MASLRLRYVHSFIDRNGHPRHYFRRPGFERMTLPGMPGSAEFMEAYQAALAGQTAPRHNIGASRTVPGTINALVVAYYNKALPLLRSAITRSTYRNILERFRREHGDKRVAMLRRKDIVAMLAAKAETPGAANHWLRMLRTLMGFAIDEGMIEVDPTARVKDIKTKSSGFHSWTEEEIAAFEAWHPVGSKARLALALLIYTAQRRADVVRMGPQHVRVGLNGAELYVKQQKTDTELLIPVVPELQRVLDATPCQNLSFLTTAHGQPFTAAGFGGWFRERCDDAGLPKECAAHGLRKAACRRLAEAGCSASQIAAVSGHKTLREVQRYVEAADKTRLARSGMDAVRLAFPRTKTGSESGNSQ
jgi:integrase